jgi:hypothetical protein
MRQKREATKPSGIKDIRRVTRKQYGGRIRSASCWMDRVATSRSWSSCTSRRGARSVLKTPTPRVTILDS